MNLPNDSELEGSHVDWNITEVISCLFIVPKYKYTHGFFNYLHNELKIAMMQMYRLMSKRNKSPLVP